MTIVKSDPDITRSLAERGFAVVRGAIFRFPGLEDYSRTLKNDWMHLVVDTYMADGGRYRLRRFGRIFFVPATGELLRLPHSPVFQSRDVNNFAGGFDRNFAPLRDATFNNPWLLELIRFDFGHFEVRELEKLSDSWEVWIHQIRIHTDDTAVCPAPEGVHHDGHDFIAMHLINRQNVEGGGSVLCDNSGNEVHTCLLKNPLDTIYADDSRVMHAVDPVFPALQGTPAHRDMLIIDFDYRPRLLRPDRTTMEYSEEARG